MNKDLWEVPSLASVLTLEKFEMHDDEDYDDDNDDDDDDNDDDDD